MQLAIGFMHLAAVGRRNAILHFHCLLEKKVIDALECG